MRLIKVSIVADAKSGSDIVGSLGPLRQKYSKKVRELAQKYKAAIEKMKHEDAHTGDIKFANRVLKDVLESAQLLRL